MIENLEDVSTLNTSPAIQAEEPPRKRRLRMAGWIAFTTFFLLLFILVKLPEHKVKGYVEAQIASSLSESGIGFSVRESRLSLGLGLSVKMRDLLFTFPEAGQAIQLEYLQFKPSLLSFLVLKPGGSISAEHAGGSADVGFKIAATRIPGAGFVPKSVDLSFDLDEFDLGKTNALRTLTRLEGGALVSGDGSFAGEMAQPASWKGDLSAQIQKLVIEKQTAQFQTMMGPTTFPLPRLGIESSEIDVDVSAGKVQIRKFQIGKPGSKDDLIATVTGNIGLANPIAASQINLTVKFTLSQNVLQALGIATSFLEPGKKADGSYVFVGSGRFDSPQWEPQP